MKTIYITETQKKKINKAIAAQDQVGGKVNAGVMDAVAYGGGMCENVEDDEYKLGAEKGISPYYHVTEGAEPNRMIDIQQIIKSDKFKAWFGDWENDPQNASKVVDKSGIPLIVHHGSPKFIGNKFDREKIGHSINRGEGGVFCTTQDMAWAKRFSYPATQGSFSFLIKPDYSKPGDILSGFLNLRHPLDFFHLTDEDWKNIENMIRDTYFEDLADREGYMDNQKKVVEKYLNHQLVKHGIADSIKNGLGDFGKQLKRYGYDGLIADMGAKDGAIEYCFLEPNQFKSIYALSFSPDNESIYENKQKKNDKGETVPEKCDKCGGDVVMQIHGEPIYICADCGKYFGTVPFTLKESKNYDIGEIGGVNCQLNFDDDAYVEWLSDNELQDIPEVKIQFIKDYCSYSVEYLTAETFHSFDYDDLTYDEIVDTFGENMGMAIINDCMDGKEHSFETLEYIDDTPVDLSNPNELNNAAIKYMRTVSEPDGRGFILTNGTIIDAGWDHIACTRIPGIESREQFVQLGNIRFSPSGLELSKYPTNAQLNALKMYCELYQHYTIYVDLVNEKIGKAGFQYSGINYSELINDLHNYFVNGVKQKKQIYESIQDVYNIAEDYDLTEYKLLSEFKYDKEHGIKVKKWNLIPAKQYHTLLKRYMDSPEMARIPYNIVNDWFTSIIIPNALYIEFITNFAGHASSNAFDVESVNDVFGANVSGYDDGWKFLESLGFYDWCKLPDGSDGWSDYGLSPLFDVISEYSPNLSAEEILILINRCLDVGHCSGDLASAFIEGGSNTCDYISNSINENIETEIVNPDDVDLSSFKIKKNLNPKFWKNGVLDSKIRMKLLDIADDFIDFLGIDWAKPEDITMTGSLANFNWDENYSDIDLHIIMDYSDVDERTDFVSNYFYSQKKLWNEEHSNITIMGFPVEVFVQDINEKHDSSGVYSLEKNKWIIEPEREKMASSKVNKSFIKDKVSDYMNKIDKLEYLFSKTKNDEYKLRRVMEKSDELFDKIKGERKLGFEKSGGKEINNHNIIFKALRRNGYIGKLVNIKSTAYDKLKSLQ